jgi:hypothetical protein
LGNHEIGGQKREMSPFTHPYDFANPEGKVEFSGSKSIVAHAVISFYVKFSFEVSHFFFVGMRSGGATIKKVAGIHQNYIGLLPS